jgi:tRNA (guanine37-N1)-methyltransferase
MSDAPKSHGRKAISATLTPKPLMEGPPELQGAWVAKVITLFPEVFPGILGASLTGKALQEGLWRLETIDLRTFGEGKHRVVDDTPAGGGAGMVLKPDIIAKALDEAARGTPKNRTNWPVVYLSPRGKPFTQAMAEAWSKAQGLTMLCGRFEGVDERVIEHYGLEEVSLGDFVMTGGEIAAEALIDATVRLIPRVLGNQASAGNDSFSAGLLEHPQYTKPSVWQGRTIPEVLLSGHHGKIAVWRKATAERLTKERRPDLWRAYCATHNMDPGEDQEL